METWREFANRWFYPVKSRFVDRLFEKLIETRLKAGGDPIDHAILRAMRRQFQPEEIHELSAVEALQREYRQSSQQIDMVYYGVGGPTRHCSPQELRRGVAVRETVSWGMSRISAPSWKGRLLFSIIRQSRPEAVLELGTGYGISGLYQIAALKLNQRGRFHTTDGSPANLTIAEELFAELGCDRWQTFLGPLQEILSRVLEQVGGVDVAFIDADHSYESTMRYVEAILPHLSREGVLVFDDIRWSTEMLGAWRDISKKPWVSRAIDLYALGICLKGPSSLRARLCPDL